jgi:hypothetical protein
MVDPKRAAKLIREHFAQLTTEQFIENLKRACPEVFEVEQDEQITPESKTEKVKKDSDNLSN